MHILVGFLPILKDLDMSGYVLYNYNIFPDKRLYSTMIHSIIDTNYLQPFSTPNYL